MAGEQKIVQNLLLVDAAALVKIIGSMHLFGFVQMDRLQLCTRLDYVYCCMNEELFRVELL